MGPFVANVLTIRRLADLQAQEGVRLLGVPGADDGLSCNEATPEEQPGKRLARLGLAQAVPADHWLPIRLAALTRAVVDRAGVPVPATR